MAILRAPARTAPAARPRRWNVDVDGICWLPRMADKARMREAGTLGPYLMGQSPVDKALLQRLGMTTDEFVAIVSAQPDDVSLLAALRARGFDEDSVRRWCAKFTAKYAGFIPLWDLDEGYREPKSFERPVIAFARAIEGPVMSAFRKIVAAP